MREVTYLKCKICGAFYEADTEHTCKAQYYNNRSASAKVADEIKNIISKKIYGTPYEHNDPKLYSVYEKVIGIAKLNLDIRAKYPWSIDDAERILKESIRLLDNTADRYEWHNLAENPDDLPSDPEERVNVKIVWDNGDSDYYTDYYYNGRWANDNLTLRGTITKWKYIEHD